MPQLTRDRFEQEYGAPFKIKDKSLEDYHSIYKDAYRPMIMECKTIGEMREVIKQFQFLAWDAWDKSKTLTDEDAARIVEILNQGREAKVKEGEVDKYAAILLPLVMMQAFPISKKFGIPEYYAALQYIRAMVFKDTGEQNAYRPS